MTRKDYVLLATACEEALIDAAGTRERNGVALAVRSIADRLADDNKAFDRASFLKACGLSHL